MIKPHELKVQSLGPCTLESPLARLQGVGFVPETSHIRYQHKCGPGVDCMDDVSFEEAGPRRLIFFDPAKTTAAVATCGGLSPGLNNVIRSVYSELTYNYHVPRVLGVRNGYQGLNPAAGHKLVELNPGYLEHIHYLGGTVLGSSRGHQEPAVMVDTLERERDRHPLLRGRRRNPAGHLGDRSGSRAAGAEQGDRGHSQDDR